MPELYMDFAKTHLRPYWDEMVARANPNLDPQQSAAEFNRVLEAYTEYGAQGRYFHSVKHLVNLFEIFDIHRKKAIEPDKIIAFIFYHDIVYNTDEQYPLNEELSAQDCEASLKAMGFEEDFITPVARWVRASKTHKLDPIADPDGALCMDIDMTTVGSDSRTYEQNTSDIDMEFAPMTNTKLGMRIAYFINPCLKGGVYLRDDFREAYESQAIDNITYERDYIENALALYPPLD